MTEEKEYIYLKSYTSLINARKIAEDAALEEWLKNNPASLEVLGIDNIRVMRSAGVAFDKAIEFFENELKSKARQIEALEKEVSRLNDKLLEFA